jgi:hydroxymethylpyrimidine pyrophosphatase-like HAD family hydrolase
MKFAALALDYDGTIAVNDRFDPAVREAVAGARAQGLTVLLVTGRRLADLRNVAGDLSCFDVVVAENGAVLHFPSSGRHVAIGHPPSPAFLSELRRRGVQFAVGETIVETDARSAETTLEVLRALEQPLILAFNRSRLMVLPQAVSKSTGLKQALLALRISIHNTIGIGDAENDHDLLDACEVGVAVSWGSATLRAVADEVIFGSGPPDVAEYIRRVAAQPRLSAAQMGRRRMFLGHEYSGERVSLAIRGRSVLIAGEPGTGKSWLAGLLCEQLILQGYCVCVIDPEGDYRSLEALPSVVMLGGEEPPPHARELARALRHPDVSVIIDLSKLAHRQKLEYIKSLLPQLSGLRRQTGLPHKILLDEAHYYLGDDGRLIDQELAGYILVTYRISAIADAIREMRDSVVMVTRESDPFEAETLLSMCRPTPSDDVARKTFGTLSMSEAALLPGPEEARNQVRRFQLAPRLTSHVRHRAKYLDMPVIDARSFVFTERGRPGPRAGTLKEFVGLLAALPGTTIEGHLARHDFSRWLGDVFRDQPLASHVRSLEERVGAEDSRDIAAEVAQAIRARYETTVPATPGDQSAPAAEPAAVTG